MAKYKFFSNYFIGLYHNFYFCHVDANNMEATTYFFNLIFVFIPLLFTINGEDEMCKEEQQMYRTNLYFTEEQLKK